MENNTNFSNIINVWKPADNSFEKRIVRRGTDTECPNEGTTCHIVVTSSTPITVSLGSKVQSFIDPVDFTIGEADCHFDIIIEKCLISMKLKEVAELNFELPKPHAELNNKDCEKTKFNLIIELNSWSNMRDIYDLNVYEKLKYCAHHKNIGVDLFKEGNHVWAFRRFSKGLKYLILINTEDLDESNKEEYTLLKQASYINISACQLTTGKYEHVVKNCNKALHLDPKSAKALFRRGTAYLYLQEYEKATEDFESVLLVDRNNLAARKQLAAIKNKIKTVESGFAEAMKKFLNFPGDT